MVVVVVVMVVVVVVVMVVVDCFETETEPPAAAALDVAYVSLLNIIVSQRHLIHYILTISKRNRLRDG
jgi:hypothetical protein